MMLDAEFEGLRPRSIREQVNRDSVAPVIQRRPARFSCRHGLITTTGFTHTSRWYAVRRESSSQTVQPRRTRLVFEGQEQVPKDWQLYEERQHVECFFDTLKRFRRIALRCEKTVTSFMGVVHLSCGMMWLR